MTDISNSKRPKIEEQDTSHDNTNVKYVVHYLFVPNGIISTNLPSKNSGPPTIRFRNYKAKDETLQASSAVLIPTAIPEDLKLKEELAKEKQILIDNHNRIIQESTSTSNLSTDLSTITIIPKRPNWDLKRDLSPKLAILDKRTQNAIHDILREKIQKTTKNSSSSTASSSTTTTTTTTINKETLDEQYTGSMDAATLARLVTQEGPNDSGSSRDETLDDDTNSNDGGDTTVTPVLPSSSRRRYADDDDE